MSLLPHMSLAAANGSTWPITDPAESQSIELQDLPVNRDAMPGMGQTSPSNLGASLRKADIDNCKPRSRSARAHELLLPVTDTNSNALHYRRSSLS